MSQRNLNASNKTHKFLSNKLKDKQTFNTYKKFEKELNIKDDFIVAVSGGPDSLALSFLSIPIALLESHPAFFLLSLLSL